LAVCLLEFCNSRHDGQSTYDLMFFFGYCMLMFSSIHITL
jgi:hypothetical protein